MVQTFFMEEMKLLLTIPAWKNIISKSISMHAKNSSILCFVNVIEAFKHKQKQKKIIMKRQMYKQTS